MFFYMFVIVYIYIFLLYNIKHCHNFKKMSMTVECVYKECNIYFYNFLLLSVLFAMASIYCLISAYYVHNIPKVQFFMLNIYPETFRHIICWFEVTMTLQNSDSFYNTYSRKNCVKIVNLVKTDYSYIHSTISVQLKSMLSVFSTSLSMSFIFFKYLAK